MKQLFSLADALHVGAIEIPNRVFLAPMSGVTDEPFRKRAVGHGAGLVVGEMIASGELLRGRRDANRRLRRPDGSIHVVQIAGREPAVMAEGARIAAGEGADIIDINMGCPAKKVTGGDCGSALMRTPDLAVALIDAVVGAVSVPVTVKMRLGWDDASLNAPDLARRAEGAGARMITVHGRTRCQFYKGAADWSAIRAVKDAVGVPVVANGDVTDLGAAEAALARSGADAVMVGRGAYGRPWQPALIAGAAGAAAPRDIGGYVTAHYEDMLALYGCEAGLRHARKHLGWYLGLHAPEAPAPLRRLVMTSQQPREVIAALARAFTGVADAPPPIAPPWAQAA